MSAGGPGSGDAPHGQKQSLLFVSCDLVGSTALKQAGEPWEEILLSFYLTFPERLGEIGAEDGVPFELWKPIGDELVFKVPVDREMDVAKAVRSWLRALAAYESDESFQKNVGKSTKGGAFIATFPGPDVEASVLRNPQIRLPTSPSLASINDAAIVARDHSQHIFDYFGPSFDTGFRVIGQSTPRHFTLSVEVALAMLRAADNDVGDNPLKDMLFLGGRELRGVWKGRDYPLFAIDRRYDDTLNAAMKKMTGEGVFDPGDAKELLRACVLSNDLPTALYLPNSELEPLRREPDDALADIRKIGDDVRGGIDEQADEEDEAHGSPADEQEHDFTTSLGDNLLPLSMVMEEIGMDEQQFEALDAAWGFPEPDLIEVLDDEPVEFWHRSTVFRFLDLVENEARRVVDEYGHEYDGLA